MAEGHEPADKDEGVIIGGLDGIGTLGHRASRQLTGRGQRSLLQPFELLGQQLLAVPLALDANMTDTARGKDGPTEFLPKLLTVWREGYDLAALRADALAGLTVAIVALPLSMAIAIASGVGPERGLYTAIVGGFLVSALGGSRYQVGGPAGAFIVLVSACVMATGVQGLILATVLSGFVLIAAGALRLGTYIRYIPYPVTVGFTAGIAVIIFASQLREIFGLTLAGSEPGEILPKLEALWAARGTVTWAALVVAALTAAVILVLRQVRPHWPGMLIAVVLASVLAAGLGLPVSTIGGRFGELPQRFRCRNIISALYMVR